MNFLKIIFIAIVLGLAFAACTNNEVCYECTASDPNGVGTPVSNQTCDTELTQAEKDAFRAEFESQHNPASYTIQCSEL